MSEIQATQNQEDLQKILQNMSLKQLKKLAEKLNQQKVNVLLVGGTGVGKSSTVNALFNREETTVGKGARPETQEITTYDLGNLVIWDTPGLGDSPENDARFKTMLADCLNEIDENGFPVIDLVLLLLDGGSKDYSSAYTLISEIIAPNLGKESANRLLIAINKADKALEPENWDIEQNCPDGELVAFLDEKVETTRERIFNASGLNVTPIYYSAGNAKRKPYNLAKLLDLIMEKLPRKKRLSVYAERNTDRSYFAQNDSAKNYEKSIWDKVIDGAKELFDEYFPQLVDFLKKPDNVVVLGKMAKTGWKFIKELLKKEGGK